MASSRQSNLLVWLCDGAGLVGMASAVLLCGLAFRVGPGAGFWITAGVSLAGNLIYMTQVLARRATGNSDLTWRELVLANIVPLAALVVTAAIVAQGSGLFRLPIGPTTPADPPVIKIAPGQNTS